MNKSIAAAVVGIIAAVIVLLVVFLPTANDRQPLEPGPDRPKATVPPEQVLLGETPKDPAEFLVWAATAPSSRVNEDAIEAIGSLSGSWTDEALAALLVTDEDGDYEDDEFAGAALLALARRGNPDLPRLEQLIEISDEDWDIDAMIVTAFGEIPGEKSLSLIVMMMNREDPYEDVLMAAIPALAKHGTPDATDAIKSLLDNEEEDVQATAAAVLLRFGDADAERMMDAFIADPDGSDWDEE
ncbi:MAG: HEAT repeat domain-containing protein, partial [Planctomycetota bacterium]